MLAGSEANFPRLEASLMAALERGDVWREYAQLRRQDGRQIDVTVSMSPVYGPADEPLGRVAILRDVSRETALQAQRDRFLTHAAHELRTPVSNIKTRLYLARRQPDRLDYHLDVLDEVTEQMRVLIEDLLDVVRLQRGQHGWIARTWLQEVIDRVLAAQQPDAERKGIQLAWTGGNTAGGLCRPAPHRS
jgi:signal transduction histidine kinase